jgi:hypothetical protein
MLLKGDDQNTFIGTVQKRARAISGLEPLQRLVNSKNEPLFVYKRIL